jgi:hypothetical protein
MSLRLIFIRFKDVCLTLKEYTYRFTGFVGMVWVLVELGNPCVVFENDI